MAKKKTVFFVLMFFMFTSCETMDSVKRGLTGEKAKGGDEFLVMKKDPLILPPDFDKLPTPDEKIAAVEELSSFEKKFKIDTSTEDISQSGSSTEQSILKRIQKK